MKTAEEAVNFADDALRTGVLASAKESLRGALKELEQEIRRKNDQITLLIKDIASMTKERDGIRDDAIRLRAEVKTLTEARAAQLKEIADYRTAQLASIERSSVASEEKAKASRDAERAAAVREQAAQSAQAAYDGQLERVRSERSALQTSVEREIAQALGRLFPEA